MTVFDIDVCVCTYRRTSIIETLTSLASLEKGATVSAIRVIVADNDEVPSAQATVTSLAAELGLDVLYVHAPARNISVARNACLDASTAPLIAFIDDDETADPAWLLRLLEEYGRSSAQAVFGPVVAIYGDDAPNWVRTADLHSIRPVIRRNMEISTGYTCNVLIRRDCLNGLRFEPALGRSGGEDTWFFHCLARSGARFSVAPQALTYEPVPPARARLGWLLRRSFRSGQTHGRMLRDMGIAQWQAGCVAAAKLLACTGGVVMTLPSPAGWRRWAVRGALHAGVVARLIGQRDLDIY